MTQIRLNDRDRPPQGAGDGERAVRDLRRQLRGHALKWLPAALIWMSYPVWILMQPLLGGTAGLGWLILLLTSPLLVWPWMRTGASLFRVLRLARRLKPAAESLHGLSDGGSQLEVSTAPVSSLQPWDLVWVEGDWWLVDSVSGPGTGTYADAIGPGSGEAVTVHVCGRKSPLTLDRDLELPQVRHT